MVFIRVLLVFLRKILHLFRSTTKLKYPLYLIPKKADKILTNEEIPRNDYLGVWVEAEVDLKDEDNKLDAGHIKMNLLPHYSTNKIPPTIDIDLDIEFNKDVKKIYLSPWEEGEDGVIPLDEHFSYNGYRKHFFMLIDKLDGHKGKIIRTDKKNKEFDFVFELKIVHKPLKANLWHFEFEVNTSDGMLKNIEVKKKESYHYAIGSKIRSHIRQIAKFEVA